MNEKIRKQRKKKKTKKKRRKENEGYFEVLVFREYGDLVALNLGDSSTKVLQLTLSHLHHIPRKQVVCRCAVCGCRRARQSQVLQRVVRTFKLLQLGQRWLHAHSDLHSFDVQIYPLYTLFFKYSLPTSSCLLVAPVLGNLEEAEKQVFFFLFPKKYCIVSGNC